MSTPQSADVLASSATNVALAIGLYDAAQKIGRADHYYQDIIDRRLDSMIGYLRLEQ